MNLPYRRLAALGFIVATGALLAGCDDSYLDTGPGRSERPISSATLAQMSKIDTTPSSPVLIRTFKKEAELEIWKMTSEGRYALLKTYPICRWSGQLGPKKVEGDMQVPEGFYTIEPGQLNPNSHYYLAFNVGYPNAYDRAYGRTGGSVMVHGVCSSAGCFSMTDEQVADIYAIARDAFRGGQREIQLESYPFRMTPENMAKYRLDPNIAFWKELKNGSDHFEVAKTEPPVVICGKHYVFGATANGPVSASSPCPALRRDDEIEALVAEKEAKDIAKVAELAASGVKAVRTVYADGGQNPVFAGYKDTSDPDALVGGPQDIVLNDAPRPAPAVVKVAAADAAKQHAWAAASRTAPIETASTAPAESAAQPRPQPLTSTAGGGMAGMWGASTQNVKNWLHLGGQDQPAQPEVAAYIPDQPIPTDVPLPPRRDVSLAQADKPPHVAQKVPLPPSKPGETSPPPSAPDAGAAATAE
jgi:murein L,D-transpeptidase YafK